jgi:hypothetical protein
VTVSSDLKYFLVDHLSSSDSDGKEIVYKHKGRAFFIREDLSIADVIVGEFLTIPLLNINVDRLNEMATKILRQAAGDKDFSVTQSPEKVGRIPHHEGLSNILLFSPESVSPRLS